jgi:hypothetical protein
MDYANGVVERMQRGLHGVVETEDFRSDAKAAGIDDEEREAIIEAIAANPRAGDLIVGSGGAREVRFAGKGRGKSGGYRIITFFGGDDIPVFLLNVFSKNQKINLDAAEVNELRQVLKELAHAYREGSEE